jgi:hypothetical protein
MGEFVRVERDEAIATIRLGIVRDRGSARGDAQFH